MTMAQGKSQPVEENGPIQKTGHTTTLPMSPASGGDTGSGVNSPSTVTSTTDSTRGSLSNISASSIKRTDNASDDDSSAFDSSSDTECDDDSIKRAIDRIPGALAPGEARVLPNGGLKLCTDAVNPVAVRPSATGASAIGAIAVHNSSDITFGNKTYIKGQVVIKNIYQDRKNGTVNDGYQAQENDATATNAAKKVPPESIPPQPRTWQSSLKTIIKDKPLLSFIVMISLMIVLCAIVAVISILTASEDDFLPDPKPLRLVTRTEWLAQPPRDELTDLKLPVNNVIIAHTATEACTTQAACRLRVRLIQMYNMDGKNYDDIVYNFLIGNDGNIYIGRGWHKAGAHTQGYNARSEGIAFVGDYNYANKPTNEQIKLLQQLLDLGVRERYISSKYKIYASEQLDETVPTGKWLVEALRTIPEFVDKPSPPANFFSNETFEQY
uniref:Peptidoglycan recognition protein family domain-containing protein n=1 Tax=Anopheles farauti TaxID=69004 RepID=A0A499FUF3_9DIPT